MPFVQNYDGLITCNYTQNKCFVFPVKWQKELAGYSWLLVVLLTGKQPPPEFQVGGVGSGAAKSYAALYHWILFAAAIATFLF